MKMKRPQVSQDDNQSFLGWRTEGNREDPLVMELKYVEALLKEMRIIMLEYLNEEFDDDLFSRLHQTTCRTKSDSYSLTRLNKGLNYMK